MATPTPILDPSPTVDEIVEGYLADIEGNLSLAFGQYKKFICCCHREMRVDGAKAVYAQVQDFLADVDELVSSTAQQPEE